MVDKRETSVTVPFGGDADLFQKNLVMEAPYQVKYLTSGYYVIYLYPAVPADLKTSNGGTFVYAPTGSTKTRSVANEYVEFSGSSRAATRYPAGYASIPGVFSNTGATITEVWSEYYGKDGSVVNPVFSYDYATGEVVSSHEVYGAVRVDYTTSYRVMHYTPQTDFSYRTGFTIEMDTLIAFYKGKVATYKMGVDFVSSTEAANLDEVIKVYSEIVVDEEGAWEVPDDFPNAETVLYNNVSGYPGPNPASYLTNQKIVRVVYADVKRGRLYERRFGESLEQPFSPALAGGHWYKPKYKLSNSTPDGADSDLLYDISKKVTELTAEYGIT